MSRPAVPLGELPRRPHGDGECYRLFGTFFRWLSPTQALLGDKDQPVFVQFSTPPAIGSRAVRWGMNETVVVPEGIYHYTSDKRGMLHVGSDGVAVRDGTYNYTNEFGVSLVVSKLTVLGWSASVR
jgi:hypothetical protein